MDVRLTFRGPNSTAARVTSGGSAPRSSAVAMSGSSAMFTPGERTVGSSESPECPV